MPTDIASMQQPFAKGQAVAVEYVKRPGLFSLSIVNFLLNLLTLFIYRFWAKTRVRRHIWASIRLNGEPLEYTGTGKELFLGALIVFLVLVLPTVILFAVLSIVLGPQHWGLAVAQLVVVFIYLLLYGMAVYRARRYRLSRTLWRGIRGTLVGSSWTFSLLYFGSMILRSMTMGWTTPAMNLELQQRLIRDMRFGDAAFGFKGRAGPLYPTYAVCWFATLIMLVTLIAFVGIGLWAWFGPVIGTFFQAITTPAQSPPGDGSEIVGLVIFAVVILIAFGYYVIGGIIWSFYQAREMRVFWSYTTIHNARFRMNATAGSLMRLWLGNVALFVFTLGIAIPFIAQRNARYVCNRLTVDGTIDIQSILQSRHPIDRRGEGLAEAFDIDMF